MTDNSNRIEAHQQFLTWLMPTVEEIPPMSKSLRA